MIKPNKYTDVNHSILEYSSLILKRLNIVKLEHYNDLFSFLLNTKGENTRFLLMPALNFLFILGKIDYDVDKDIIKYI